MGERRASLDQIFVKLRGANAAQSGLPLNHLPEQLMVRFFKHTCTCKCNLGNQGAEESNYPIHVRVLDERQR